MRNILHFIVIFTFCVGIIAPTCGFAWNGGEYSYIEICTNNGIEKIAVKGQTPDTPHQTQEECQFCFNNTHLAKDFITSDTLQLPIDFSSTQHFRAYQTTIISALTAPYNSRAPPVFI